MKQEDGEKQKEILDKAAQVMKMLEQLGLQAAASNASGTNGTKEHKFWSTQPVPQTVEELKSTTTDGPIRPEKPKVPKKALSLLEDFEWFELDLGNEQDKNELYVLLNENYVEDLESLFRFDYPPHFLEWYYLIQ